jgi:hypothetical protein
LDNNAVIMALLGLKPVWSHKFNIYVRTNQPAAVARVRVREEHVGFVVDKVALGQIFSEYIGFPCQSSFHQFLHHNHPSLAQ